MRENHLSLTVALLALLATAYSAFTSRQSLLLSRQNEQISLFNNFQEQYAIVSGRFPPQLLKPDFQPARGTDDYDRLEGYWIFVYAEWFATNQLESSAFRDLWTGYYAPLVLNAMAIPSLRHVLIDMQTTYGEKRPSMKAFYQALQQLASAAGEPLTEPQRPHQ